MTFKEIADVGILCGMAVSFSLFGCSQAEQEFVPVRGKITLAGSPLGLGHVSFRPDASRGNGSLHHPSGPLTRNGDYEMKTVGKQGAPPGWYKVLIFADENQAAGVVHPQMPKWAIAEKYTREETTDLRVEVIPNAADGAFDFEVTK